MNSVRIGVGLLFLALVGLSGCGSSTSTTSTSGPAGSTGSGSGGFVASCDGKPGPGHTCTEFDFPDQATADGERQDCNSKGKTGGSGCPKAGALGSCEASGITTFYYSDGAGDINLEKMQCQQAGGTFHNP